jgi:hypothetical protein
VAAATAAGRAFGQEPESAADGWRRIEAFFAEHVGAPGKIDESQATVR